MMTTNVSLVRMTRAIQQQKNPYFGYPAGVSIVDLVPDDMKSLVISFDTTTLLGFSFK